MVVMLIAVVDVDDVILTEPSFCLLSDEDILFVLAHNFHFVCTVCNSGFASRQFDYYNFFRKAIQFKIFEVNQFQIF